MSEYDYYQALLGTIWQQQPAPALDTRFPWLPLDAPGMPPPGPAFTRVATQGGDRAPLIEKTPFGKRCVSYGPVLAYLYRRALYDASFVLPVEVKTRAIPASVVPGHKFGQTADGFRGGPSRSRVLVLSKQPNEEELSRCSLMLGPSFDEWWNAVDTLGLVGQLSDWYVTNLVKWPNLNPSSGTLPKSWVADCLPLLYMELGVVQPDYILCLGTDASKALLDGSPSVEAMTGRSVDVKYTVPDGRGGYTQRIAKAMAMYHPGYAAKRPEIVDVFVDQLARFVRLTQGESIGEAEKDVRHCDIYTESQLSRVVDEILADPVANRVLAFDGEWHGEHPSAPNAYLRTVQFSHKPKVAFNVVLRYQGGAPAFVPNVAAAMQQLRRLTTPTASWRPRVGGHFFRADLPWLLHEGLDLRKQYAPHPDPNVRTEGGWDSSLLVHSVTETASFKLEDIGVRKTSVPRYDQQLQRWKKWQCKVLKQDGEALDGYGMAPACVLHPYGAYDADTTRRLFDVYLKEVTGPDGQKTLSLPDAYGNDCWQPYWISHRASLAFLEMEMTGIMVDSERVDKLTRTFMDAYDYLLTTFRRNINWPEFKPKSVNHVRALLFGDAFAQVKRKTAAGDVLVNVRPPTALTLGLTPIKSTGKRSRPWDQLVRKNQLEGISPATDKETLGILGQASPYARQLRDLKFIGQVLSTVLRRPVEGEDGEPEEDDDGNLVYAKGLAAAAHWDRRVRTHIFQTKETGRCSSARPNLQAISKRREDDYRRILGAYDDKGQPVGDYIDQFPPQYEHPVRSLLCATPGWVLVENDYKGAELAVIAWMSGDPNFIEHVRRNNLDESDPDYYDIHSNAAVRTFRLACAPNKKALKAIGKAGLRVAAKNVMFGVPYGRGAEAIARQCREEGTEVTVAETQAMIDNYYDQYPLTAVFLAECRARALDPGWLVTSFLRRRRFARTSDDGVRRDQERSAMNFPVQGTVADAVYRALDNLYEYRETHPDIVFRILLQIHDAILFEVRADCYSRFVATVPKTCMVDNVPIWPRRLNGELLPVAEPYHFAVDFETCVNWGERITEAQASALGIDFSLVL